MQLVLQDSGGIGHRIHRINRAIGLDFEGQLVTVQALAFAGRLDLVGDAADRRIERVDGDQADGRIFRAVFIGRNIALAVVDREFHADLRAIVEGAQNVIRIEDLDVRRRIDLAGGDRARTGSPQRHALGAFGMHAQRQLLDVQDDVDDVLAHALDGREFVHDAVDLDGGDGGALQGRQQDTTKAVAERHAKATLQRLSDDARLAGGVLAGFDGGLFRTDQLVPVSFDHGQFLGT